jgi:hypothetical protein
MASVEFSIVIPEGIAPKYISASTKSASITVNGGTPAVINCTTTCSTTLQAPVGSDTFAAQLFDAQNGTGNLLSQGMTTATISLGVANVVSLTFAGIVKTLAISSSGPAVVRGVPATVTISLVAKDAGGNTIVGTYDQPVTLANSDTSGATALSALSVSSSSTAVTLTYNGDNSFSGTTITASDVSATNSPTLSIANSCVRLIVPNKGYYPCELQHAYNLPTRTRGAGQTVAIVDAYDDPNAEADLAVYRSTFGLPACTTANGCFRKVNQTGGTVYPAPDAGWAAEISLDLDMVSAICPNCHILLVEANSPFFFNLGTSVNMAASLGANVISNSYGNAEFPGETGLDAFYNHPGVAITVSSGDGNYVAGTQYPASSPFVTAVGGTRLSVAASARGWSESVWNTKPAEGAGSGCSAYELKPAWQTDGGCAFRMVADVAAVADPATGVAVYDTYSAPGWQVYGGTSVSAPVVGAAYALAGNTANLLYGSYPYAHPSAMNDVLSGNNGTCSPSYFCTAGAGYDGPTGLGTPSGTGALGSSISSSIALAGGATLETLELRPAERVCSEPQAGEAACYALRRTDIP